MTESVKKISEVDLNKLLELYKKAQNTPVMLVGSVDLSQEAWNEAGIFQQELGKKYDYDWEKVAINGKGEVIDI